MLPMIFLDPDGVFRYRSAFRGPTAQTLWGEQWLVNVVRCLEIADILRYANVSSTMTQQYHLILEHVIHGVLDSAGSKSRLPLAGEGHPVGSEGCVIIHHDGRSGEMFSGL